MLPEVIIIIAIIILFIILLETTPVIDTGPETIRGLESITINIGNNLCIHGADPQMVIILCGHSINGFVSPIPSATWTAPSSVPPAAVQIFDSPHRIGMNDGYVIDNDGDPVESVRSITGEYTCTLTNSEGSDTATTNLGK